MNSLQKSETKKISNTDPKILGALYNQYASLIEKGFYGPPKYYALCWASKEINDRKYSFEWIKQHDHYRIYFVTYNHIIPRTNTCLRLSIYFNEPINL